MVERRAEGDLRLTIPAGDGSASVHAQGSPAFPRAATQRRWPASIKNGPATDLAALTHGGPPRWPEVLKTAIAPGADDWPVRRRHPRPPREQPWLCQMRLTGFDFLDGGRRAAVCTWDGDVWLVSGLDAPTGELSWKRIASGLFQPLGLKILDGNIFVGCRDQIVILRDLERRRRDRLL